MTVTYFNSGATLGVYFAPTNGVTDAAPTWVDITADVREGLTINRGRSSERDTFQTGTLTLSLDNRTRKYDPEYAAGAYFGQLLPGRPIKVEITYSATTKVLFRGFIQGWPQTWEPSDNDSVVQIVAHDAFKYLALARLPDSYYYATVIQDAVSAAGWGWWRLGEAADEITAADSSGNNYGAPYSISPVTGAINSQPVESVPDFAGSGARQALDPDYPIVGPALPIYCVGLAFTVEAWVDFPATLDASDVLYIYRQAGADEIDKHVRIYLNGAAQTLVVTLYETSGSNLTASRAIAASELGTRHHIGFVRNGSGMDGYFDGVQFATTGGTLSGTATSFGYPAVIGSAGSTATTTTGLTIDEVAVYLDDLTSVRMAAHYEAGTTAGAGDVVSARLSEVLTQSGVTWISTTLDTSSVTVRGADYTIGGGTVLGYLQALEATEQGRVFIAGDGTLTFQSRYHDLTTTVEAAFTDAAGSTLPYVSAEHEYDDSRVVNDATVSRTNGTVQRYEDATSIATYGRRSVAIDGLQGQSDAECYDLAVALVSRYKDPFARIRSLSLKPRANPSGLFPAIRDLEIGDKVSFRRAPLGGTSFTKTLTVEGIAHQINVSGEWVTTLLTAPANMPSYLILDSGTLGQLDEEKLGF